MAAKIDAFADHEAPPSRGTFSVLGRKRSGHCFIGATAGKL